MADAEELLAMNLSAEQLAAAVAETTAVVRAGWSEHPHAAIILGTGLGSLAEHITIEAEWDYRDLPHFARSTADGHRGRLLAGRLADVPILAMDGRFHAYEGYSFSQITFPIRVFAELGASFLILSNASGGLNPTLRSGDILLIDDHINLMGPLVGQVFKLPHESLYDPRLLARSEQIANEEAIPLRRGTYIAMLGPNYETRAEYCWLRTLGDAVGMSTVPEVLAAGELGLPVVAFSMVTNVFRLDDTQQTTSEEVLHAASNAEPNLRRLVTKLLTSDL
ncbi:purine nucleoside phosphorylase [Planctomycetia bacterium]|nr:purine nucleoside phosphorylase [Planctomycetia bacterium]